ncbi:hypothetical protein EDB19DRAFT_1192349 [Suillus lakei]|nr:hypothetical protein EDB19DRAFT_1192349 [Suillus lakei]
MKYSTLSYIGFPHPPISRSASPELPSTMCHRATVKRVLSTSLVSPLISASREKMWSLLKCGWTCCTHRSNIKQERLCNNDYLHPSRGSYNDLSVPSLPETLARNLPFAGYLRHPRIQTTLQPQPHSFPPLHGHRTQILASHCHRLRDTFLACFDTEGRLRPSAEYGAVACGRALNHLCLTASLPIGDDSNTRTASQQLRIWYQWRSVILPRSFDQCKALACQVSALSGRERERCQADARTALRMVVAASGDGFISPDHDSIIWRGQFTWTGDHRTAADFDWLVDYLVFCSQDHTAMGDTLLALSAMKGLGTRDRASAYLRALISAMESSSPHRLRYAALRAVSDSRLALADIDAIEDENIRHLLLTKIPPALLTAICPARAAGRREEDEPDIYFNYWRDDAYLRLIMALTSNTGWCKCLVADRHIGYCIYISNNLDEHSPAPFQLAAIFGRVSYSSPDDQFPPLVKSAWQAASDLKLMMKPNASPAFTAIIKCTDIPAADLEDIRKNVDLVMEKLKRRNKCPEITSSIQDYHTRLTKI